MSVKDYKETILQKEEEIKQLREFNKKVEVIVFSCSRKNQANMLDLEEHLSWYFVPVVLSIPTR